MKLLPYGAAIVFFIFLSISLICCKKSNSDSQCKYDAIPSSLILKITKSGIILSDTDLGDCKLSYYDNSVKKYVSDFALSSDTANRNKGLIASRLIGVLSADNKIKTYNIEYPNGWASDTLYVDYLPHTPATNCLYVQNSIKYNGQIAQTDSNFHFDSPVYVISKPWGLLDGTVHNKSICKNRAGRC